MTGIKTALGRLWKTGNHYSTQSRHRTLQVAKWNRWNSWNWVFVSTDKSNIFRNNFDLQSNRWKVSGLWTRHPEIQQPPQNGSDTGSTSLATRSSIVQRKIPRRAFRFNRKKSQHNQQQQWTWRSAGRNWNRLPRRCNWYWFQRELSDGWFKQHQQRNSNIFLRGPQ